MESQLTSEKKRERMMRLIQWMMLANWKALATGERRCRVLFRHLVV